MLVLIVALALVLTAPADGGEPSEGGPMPADSQNAPRPPGNLPDGAVPFGEDVYMVPVGRDAGGCQQYTMYSPTRAVLTVIYYRDGKGEFTTDRADAVCG